MLEVFYARYCFTETNMYKKKMLTQNSVPLIDLFGWEKVGSEFKRIKFLSQTQISKPYNFAAWWSKFYITEFDVRITEGLRISGCKEIGIRKLGFVAKTQFLCF